MGTIFFSVGLAAIISGIAKKLASEWIAIDELDENIARFAMETAETKKELSEKE